MNQSSGDTNFNSGEVPPNPFNGASGMDQGAIPTIPGFDMGAAKKAPINSHGVMTLGIMVIAAVAIWGMRSIGLKGQTGAMAADISATMGIDTNRRAVMTVEDQRLLADLSATRTLNQVPSEELQKNPFMLADALRPRIKAAPGEVLPPSASAEQIAEARQRDLIAILAEYKLQGVMGGANAVARINGRAYRVGDSLGEAAADKPGTKPGGPAFVVTAVSGREVTVKAEGFLFILSMDNQ